MSKSCFVPAMLCAAAALITIACSRTTAPPPTTQRRLNFVLVTIDTLRPDRLGCYGNTGVETPNLDRIAQRGTLFENAIAQAPLTPPSHASMFTGTYPPVHKVRDTGGFILGSDNVTLAEVLQGNGWTTAAFVGSSVLKKSFGFGQGFDVYDDEMPKPDASAAASEFPERRASDVVDRSIRWVDSQSRKPFFLWVHLFDPHAPYDPPSPFRERYKGRPYDGEVAWTDAQLGRLFDHLSSKTSAEDTIVAVLSDHGESLSEHGEWTHGVFLYDSTLRIAFLLAGPGIPPTFRVRQQARTIDLAPTVLSLLNIPVPPSVQGTTLLPAPKGQNNVAPQSYSETLFPRVNMGWSELRAVRTDRWKYIRAPKPELYDLSTDPREKTNVYDSHPSEVREFETYLKTATRGPARERVYTSPLDRKTSDQLRTLGYLGGVAHAQYELTGEGVDPKDRTEVLGLLQRAMFPESRLSSAQRIALLRRALTIDSGNPTIYYRLGEEYSKSGKDAEAIRLYQQAIDRGVQAAWLYSRIAYLYVRQGRREQAIALYEKAAQMNPADTESLSDLGTAYIESGRVDEAERAFRWALATAADYAPAHNGLGLVGVRRQNTAQARRHFERAVQLDPNLLEAQLNLGRIYRMIGANTRARACFEVFLARASADEYGETIAKVKAELADLAP